MKTNSTTSAVLNQDYYGYDLAGNRLTEQQGLSVTQSSFNKLNQTVGSSAGGPLLFTGTLNKPGTVTVGGSAATMDSTFENFSGTANVTTGTHSIPVVATSASGYASTKNYQVVVPTGTSTSPIYDSDGNLSNNGNGQTYTWDAENELTTITYTGGATSNFTYDALGRRLAIVEKNSGGTVTSTKQFVWVGATLAEERDASNTVTKRFYAQGEQISGSSYYYTRDHLGSVRELVNGSGTILTRYSYDPYGRATANHLVTSPSTTDATFQYTGDYYHAASGLNLTLFRAYDPNTAKWLSRDPVGERGGLNLYAYVQNNSINNIDPFGLCGCSTGPSSWGSAAANFAAGVAIGAFGAAAAIAFAPEIGAIATGALIAGGLSAEGAAALVTGAAGLVGVASAIAIGINGGISIASGFATHNWNQAAFNAGSLVGGVGTVFGASAIGGGDFGVGWFNPDFGGRVSSGQISQAQNIANWFGTQTTNASAAGVAGALGSAIGMFGCL